MNPGFVRLLTMKVEPFAIYEAERELRAMGVEIERRRLVDHYLVVGQLQSVIVRFKEQPKRNLHEVFAEDIVENCPDGNNKSPRFVAPFRLGLLYSSMVLIGGGFGSAGYFLNYSHILQPTTVYIVVGIVGFVMAVCFVYTYLGSKIGRGSAEFLLIIVLLLLMVAAVVAYKIFR